MKYFFTNDCYWDAEKMQIIRNDIPVDMPSSQKKLLATLLNNGKFVSHETLYFNMTGDENPYGDWKASLSNKFTRDKATERGILIRVPEIVPFFVKSKSRIGGGYKISVPEENIVGNTVESRNIWDEYRDIWYSNTYWEGLHKKARAIEKDWISKKVKLYLQGEPCSWPLIFSSSQYTPVKRDIVNVLKTEIENEIGAMVLTGAGGEGKTTILMQLCMDLYYDGKMVLYHAPTYKYDFPVDISESVFLIDNPSNTVEFKSFLTKATKEGHTVVIAARSNEWTILKESLFEDTKRSVREIEIPKISANEAKSFAHYLKTHIYWIKRCESEVEKLFYKDSYGFLYASMLMAIYNSDSLEKIAEEIIERISSFENGKKTLKILAAIVFVEQAGTKISTNTYRTLCRDFFVNEKEIKYYLRKEVVLNGRFYETRHDSISRLFFKYLFLDEDSWRFLEKEEQEEVIIAILEVYLREVEKSVREYNPLDPRVIDIAGLFSQALKVIDYEDTQEYIVQRLYESCQQNGHVILERTYHQIDNDIVKNKIAEKCFEHKLSVWGIYNSWLRNLANKLETIDSVVEYIKNLCIEMEAPIDIWNLWIKLQVKKCNGDKDISLCTIREIYKLGLKSLANNAHWWISWASFEEKYGNYGDTATEYSTRWILKEGCNRVKNNPHLWIAWANFEVACENYGDTETKYSARWIIKEGCSKLKNTHLLIKFAEIEEKVGNIGDISISDSARGILYRGCMEFPTSSHIWIKWAEIEINIENIGDYETVNSAAWVYKEACTQNCMVTDSAIWIKWVDFALNYNNIMKCSNVNEYTPSKILKYACIDHNVPSSQVWIKWASIEEERGNIGSYEEKYSAAWILKEVCMRNIDDDDQIWTKWVEFIERNKGNVYLSENYAPDVILKRKCLSGTTDVTPWIAWASIEEVNENIGDYSTEYSAAWLYKESCIKYNPTNETNCLLKWARFASKHPIYDTNGELIDARYVISYAEQNCAAFRNEQWNGLADFKNEIGYQ